MGEEDRSNQKYAGNGLKSGASLRPFRNGPPGGRSTVDAAFPQGVSDQSQDGLSRYVQPWIMLPCGELTRNFAKLFVDEATLERDLKEVNPRSLGGRPEVRGIKYLGPEDIEGGLPVTAYARREGKPTQRLRMHWPPILSSRHAKPCKVFGALSVPACHMCTHQVVVVGKGIRWQLIPEACRALQ